MMLLLLLLLVEQELPILVLDYTSVGRVIEGEEEKKEKNS